MNLSFSSPDPLKAVISDSTTNEPLYQTESHDLINRATEINKFASETGLFEPLAKIYWETFTFAPVNVIYRGERILVADFLKKQGTLLPERTFTAIDGRQYTWKVDSLLHFKLYDDSGNAIVVSHRKKYGVQHTASQDFYIEVLPSGLQILDDIVVTFIIECHLERRRAGMV